VTVVTVDPLLYRPKSSWTGLTFNVISHTSMT